MYNFDLFHRDFTPLDDRAVVSYQGLTVTQMHVFTRYIPTHVSRVFPSRARTVIHGDTRVRIHTILNYTSPPPPTYYFVFPLVLIGAAAESLLIYYELKRRVHYVRFLAIEHHRV